MIDRTIHRRTASSSACTRALLLGTLCIVATHITNARAEEGGSGHYQPGSMASFMDGVSPTEVFIARLNVVHYSGDVSRNAQLPVAGATTADLGADVAAFGLTLVWRPPWGSINQKWSYQMGATVPYLWSDVGGLVEAAPGGNPGAIRRSDSISALGDISLMPLMLNQNISPDFNINYRITLYAPTGSYKVGRLANAGKNFWTVEPTVGFMYFGQKNGREASVFVGADFNQENPDTDYKSGTALHVDSTFAQHFPLWGGVAGAGMTAYWYQQVSDDSGSGAMLGAFRARTNGIGPVVSYIGKAGGHKATAEFKWLHEFGVKNRLSGDTLFLKAMVFF